jgi:two-component system cell cycle response regulator DivK
MSFSKYCTQVWLPVSPTFVGSPWRAAAMAASATDGSTASRRKILVVEDNELSMKLVNDLLEFHGHQIFQATRGADAVRMAHDSRPHLILLNLQLPDISGLEVARALKADEATRAIPVVAVTAFAMRGDEERARNAGCDGYVTKPIRIQSFLQTVDAFLRSTP